VYDEVGNVIETTRRLLLSPLRGNSVGISQTRMSK
jgi:hypothetical protein